MNGKPTAIAYFRDSDGKTRPMQRQGRTPTDAENKLKEALRDRLAPTYEYLNRDSRLSALADQWLEEIRRSNRKPATLARYESTVNAHVRPTGDLRIVEATVPRLQRLIDRVADTAGRSQARMLGVVLTGMMGLAVRHGAAMHNSADELLLPVVESDDVRAPTADEVRELRRALARWDSKPRRRADAMRDLGDVGDLMLATGARPGEVLALRWEDVDLEHGTVALTATLIRVAGVGLVRQETPKSTASKRRLKLPRFAIDMLIRRRLDAYCDIVFPSAAGTFRWPENVRTQWAGAVAGTPVSWTTPKVCRKATAAAIEAVAGAEAAKEQLGHGSVSVTQKHYLAARIDRADQSAALEQFGAENSE
ncbi:tyrosine-type recombinase/integrase [Streptomyces sp. NPDC058650]|uniref:tyrosine-type recombinase/integrase n=1 Tax=Streptomyces sp. NPDC058650 TaxID=3346575 RepID=UPI003655C8EC